MKTTLALMLFLAPLAVAASESAPSAAMDTVSLDAKARFKQGLKLFDQGRWREALKEFEEAYRIKQVGPVRYNIGLCYDRLDEPVEALKNYHLFLREVPEERKERVMVQSAIASLEKRLSDRGKQVLMVFSAPAANLKVNDQDKGLTPWAGELSVGKHTVELSLKGYAPAKQDVELRTHSVIVDSKLTAETEAILIPPPPVALNPDQTNVPASALTSTARPDGPPKGKGKGGGDLTAWGAGVVGVGAASLIAAAACGIAAQNASNDMRNMTAPNGARAQDLHDRAQSTQTAANILYGVAGAVGIAGAGLIIGGQF